VVIEADGRPVRRAADLRNIIGLLRAGTKVRLTVLRDGRRRTVTAVIEPPRQVRVEGERVHPRLAGAVLGEIPEGSPLRGRVQGVLVREVAPGSPAWFAGLRPGDVIVEANRRPVPDLDSLRRAVRGSRSLLLNVRRGDGALFLLLR